MSEELRVTQEIELPIGIEVDGTFYKKVTMRRVRNSDIMAIQSDVRIKELSKDTLQLKQDDPVQSMKVSAALIRLFTILFQRVIIKVEGLEKITLAHLDSLYQTDMEALIMCYTELNSTGLEKSGGVDPFLRQLGISPGDSHIQ